MAAFSYKALNASGKVQKGLMESDSATQVANLLRDKGLAPIEITPVQAQKNKNNKTPRRYYRISHNDLSLMTRQLATLLSAGLPLEECLKAVSEQTEKSKVKGILLAVRAKVLEGYALGKALENFPKSFSPLYCATVTAGEQTGHLDAVLTRLADYTERQQHMRRKVQQALIYPIIMTLVSIFIVIFLLLYVVPKMIAVFKTMKQGLPTITVWLINISHFLKSYGIVILIAFALLYGLFRYALRKENFKRRYHRFLLKIPGIKHLIKIGNTARFIHTFGVLLNAGVGVIDALRISSALVTNLPIRDAISDASKNIKEGANIYLALKKTHYFQAMSLHLIASGENSGQLEKMLDKAAQNQDNELETIINTVLTLFEPMMILVMGVVVLFIVLAILLPIFSLDQFGG